MNKIYTLLCILCACVCASAQQRLTAFPGAEGYGKFTTGGRGGNVYYVTRLDDCSDADLVEGTLRWALRSGDDTPRTVLFKVCGTIVLTSKLKLEHPNVTIAGQTAPGGGICVAGACIYVCKPNVIIRHIRFRSGDVVAGNFQCLDVENTRNVIIDHCSLTWAVEECLTMYDCDSTTVQWTIIGEGLYDAGHKKGQRSYATQWGGEHGTMHHCLITNCYNRTPRFNGVRSEAKLSQGNHDHDAFVDSEFANNVIFNWGKSNSLYGGENDTTINHDSTGEAVGYNHVYMIGNYFRPGPTTQVKKVSPRYFVQGSKQKDFGRWYLSGNMFELGCPYSPAGAQWADSALQHVNEDNLFGYLSGSSMRAFNLDGQSAGQQAFDRYVLLEQYASSELQLESAAEAFASVTQHAGASLPRVDEVDARLLAEAAGLQAPQYAGATQPTWTGIINSPADIVLAEADSLLGTDGLLHPYPSLAMQEGDSLLVDTDRDGMPDVWETAHGLNPEDASDANLCSLSTLAGYTNLEYYLNNGEGEMADPIPAPQPVPVVDTALYGIRTSGTGVGYLYNDGSVYIIKNGQKYTLSGQKVR